MHCIEVRYFSLSGGSEIGCSLPLLLATLGLSMFVACGDQAGRPGSSSSPEGSGGVVGENAASGGAWSAGGTADFGDSSEDGEGSGGASDQTSGGTTGAGGESSSQLSDAFVVEVQLASELAAAAPTTVGVVSWSLPGATITSATVEFGPDESYGVVASVDLNEDNYRTLLLGLKPTTIYHFRIVAQTDAGALASEDFTLETGEATDLVDFSSIEIDEMSHERGFIVSSFWRGDGSSVIFILDADGEIVWWYDTGMNGVARARMSADGKNMWMISPDNQGAPVERVSLDTLDSERYDGVIGSHDLTAVSGATMALLEYGEIDCDSIFEIEPDGVAREVWDSQEVASGMCHGNALRYSKTEDAYTFSDVSTDIWVISRSGEFKWSLADKVDGGVSAWGGANHGHHLLNDTLVIFANRGAGNMASTVVEYDLTGNEIFNYNGGQFSANLGDVQRLPGGNTLVTYSNDGVIHEITPDKELVMKITSSGQSFGYALWLDSLYGEPSDIRL